MTRDITPVVRDWLGETLSTLPDPVHLYPDIAADAHETPQQRSWLPPVTTRTMPTFSVTNAVAGAFVALFGGFLLAVVLTQPSEVMVPAATTGGPGTFSLTGSLAQPRSGHTATRLLDGRVLVVGGTDGESDPEIGITTAELWDPETGTFGPAGSLGEGRAFHSATRLADGRVLVVGGYDGAIMRASAEVWDPSTGTFSPAGSLTVEGEVNSATLLPDGRVLISSVKPPGTPEIWDPATKAFSPAASLPGDDPVVTALADGRVLFIIDEAADDDTSPMAVVWDPRADTLSPAGSVAMRFVEHATLLPDGRVLAVGPVPGVDVGAVHPAYAAIWDPATGTFSPSNSLITEHYYSSATALPDGRVLLVGGCHGHSCHVGYADIANVWDPETATFSPAGSPAEARVEHTATLLSDGRVLVVGGWLFESPSLASAEIWSPSGG